MYWFLIAAYVYLSHILDSNLYYKIANVSYQDTIYKVANVWSSHEGSFWLCSFILLVALYLAKGYDSKKLLLFLLFYTLTSSNHIVIQLTFSNITTELNLLLQDILLSVHPPLLYLGTFSMIVYLCDLKKYREYNWTLINFSFTTFSIALGSFWAYYTLGWGYWEFDPVENIALLSWIVLLYLIHTKHPIFHPGWAFVSMLFGTLCVRSGLLDSIHSFDPASTNNSRFLFLSTICFSTSILLLNKKSNFSYNKYTLFYIAYTVIFIGTFIGLINPSYVQGIDYYKNLLIPVVLSLGLYQLRSLFSSSIYYIVIGILVPIIMYSIVFSISIVKISAIVAILFVMLILLQGTTMQKSHLSWFLLVLGVLLSTFSYEWVQTIYPQVENVFSYENTFYYCRSITNNMLNIFDTKGFSLWPNLSSMKASLLTYPTHDLKVFAGLGNIFEGWHLRITIMPGMWIIWMSSLLLTITPIWHIRKHY